MARVPFPFCQITLKAQKSLKDIYSKSFYRQQLRNIGVTLQRKRQQQEITQAELAQKIGIYEGTVGDWEHGRSIPDIRYMPKVIEFLGYDPLETDKKIN